MTVYPIKIESMNFIMSLGWVSINAMKTTVFHNNKISKTKKKSLREIMVFLPLIIRD